jgi:hypothetical protein
MKLSIENSIGADLQARIQAVANGGGMKIVGPNTFGVVNTWSRLNATFNREIGGVKRGSTALVAQSGGMSGYIGYALRGLVVGLVEVGDQQYDVYFGDLHLLSDSPCIDAGDPNFTPDPDTNEDIDGQPRIVGCHIDIGADEFVYLAILSRMEMLTWRILLLLQATGRIQTAENAAGLTLTATGSWISSRMSFWISTETA